MDSRWAVLKKRAREKKNARRSALSFAEFEVRTRESLEVVSSDSS